MNKNIVIVLAGGFVIAILVAVLVQAGLSGDKPPPRDIQAEILVAARDLRIGTELNEGDVKWQEWPEAMLFTGAIRRNGSQTPTEALTGRLKERVAAGQPMNSAMVVDASRGNLLAASLRDGHRAVGVQVRVENIAGGLIGVGDYVDVVLTYTVSRTGNSPIVRRYASETILENIRVLGIDNRSIAQEAGETSGKRAKTRQTVTLEVDPSGAEKIALASEMGDITLSLRPLGDVAGIAGAKATTDVTLSKVIGQMSAGSGGQVRVYNGAQVQYMTSGAATLDAVTDSGAVAPDLAPDSATGDMLPSADVLDAFREGIADGIARRIGGDGDE